jgi:hypothetical protein
MDRNELLHEPRHLWVPSGVSKRISDPMERVAQTVHLSCTNANTVSKWTKIRFNMTHFTLLLHWVCKKWFSSLWYVRRKPCTYLALKLTPSPNGPKEDSTWASLPRSTIGCIQNNFWPYDTFGADRAPILHCCQHRLKTDRNKIPHDPRYLGVPSGGSKIISEPMVHWHKPCTYIASRLALPPNGLKRAST